MAESSNDELKAALNQVCDAWEALKGGCQYSPDEIQTWLSRHMKPALDKARRTLGRRIPSND